MMITDWNDTELRTFHGPHTLELRLLQKGVETGRMKVRHCEQDGLAPLEGPQGPDWCHTLLMEAASEWARLELQRSESRT